LKVLTIIIVTMLILFPVIIIVVLFGVMFTVVMLVKLFFLQKRIAAVFKGI
jgi:hypothetical protein